MRKWLNASWSKQGEAKKTKNNENRGKFINFAEDLHYVTVFLI